MNFKSLFSFFPVHRKVEESAKSKIQIAKVIKIEKHPNADRLVLVRLKTATHGEIYPVVCGAKNFAEGDMVALAFPGAEIERNIHSEAHESFVLGKASIRGVQSEGMLCALFELGLSENIGEGIAIFKENTPLGLDATVASQKYLKSQI